MDDFLDSLVDSMVFTTLDVICGYCKILVVREYQYKTSFTTHMGMYRYKQMPFRLISAPYTFQIVLYIILSGARWKRGLVYFKYVIIFSTLVEEHFAHVYDVLYLLGADGNSLKQIKSILSRTGSTTSEMMSSQVISLLRTKPSRLYCQHPSIRTTKGSNNSSECEISTDGSCPSLLRSRDH